MPALALGRDARPPSDPAFKPGDYCITAFPHVRSVLQLLTAERVWALVNAARDRINYRDHKARLTALGGGAASVVHELVGMESVAADPTGDVGRFGPRSTHKRTARPLTSPPRSIDGATGPPPSWAGDRA